MLNGELINDSFRVLDSIKVSTFNAGDTIPIKHYKGQTILVGLKPFAFPFETLLIILASIFVAGLAAMVLLYWRIGGQIYLFQNGLIRDAEIISMTPISGLPISGIGQRIIVHYQYLTAKGQKVLGESSSTDYTILSSKKHGDSIKIFVSAENEAKSCVFSNLDEVRNNWQIS